MESVIFLLIYTVSRGLKTDRTRQAYKQVLYKQRSCFILVLKASTYRLMNSELKCININDPGVNLIKLLHV